MPFSDPMADGPAIQASSQRALKSGQTMKKTLAMVKAFRSADDATPIVLMGYYNPIYVYPVDRFVADAVEAGADGLIVVDVPPEEDAELRPAATAAGLNFIRLATPTTDAKRLPAVLANTSRDSSITSRSPASPARRRRTWPRSKAMWRASRRIPSLPIAVGFGVKTEAQVSALARHRRGRGGGLGARHRHRPKPRYRRQAPRAPPSRKCSASSSALPRRSAIRPKRQCFRRE